MSVSNPSQSQVAFAYAAYLKARNGDAAAAMADLQTFLIGYSAPDALDAAQPDQRLASPAMVGHSIFSAGMPWIAVIQRAQQEFEQNGGPQPSAVRIAEFRSWLEQGQPAQQMVIA